MSHFSVAVISKKPEDVDSLLEPFWEDLDKNSGACEFILDKNGDYDEEKKANGYWVNPIARWDWYEIGGRFADKLRTPNGKCDQAQIKDVDFSSDQEAYNRAIRYWEVVVEGKPLRDDESKDDFFTLYTPPYFIYQYKSKENYAHHCSDFETWALITPDGEWHETGHLGWHGVHSETYESREKYTDFLKQCIGDLPDLWITIVDCHI